jgi:lipid A ethanolaminephosphotransferase
MTIEALPFSWRRRWQCDTVAFLLLYCLLTAVLFQRPLYALAVSRLQPFDLGAWLAISTLFVLQLVFTFGFLAVVALVSTRLLKAICILFLFGNAVALYFIDSYGVVMDKAMIANVLGTNLAEASALAHPKLLGYLLLLALVPASLIVKTRIRPDRRRVAVTLIATCILGLGWIYANARSWLWLDRNFRELGGLMLPWAYVVNTARVQQEAHWAKGPETLLPDAHVTDPAPVVVVLVIGESARAANFSLYGYPRPTNPLLARDQVVALEHTQSCATYTTEALRCMLSHQGSHASPHERFEPLPGYVQRQGVDVLWRSNNFGEPPMKVASLERAPEIAARCIGEECARVGSDEVLLQGLQERLHSPGANKRLVVLHQTGSHGPLYSAKYPARFEVFRPVCRTVDLRKCSQAELVNAYDNTIVFTDYLLDRVITMLKSLGDTEAVLVYVSDHGESLGEYGLYLHGTPYLMAPNVQKEVPLVVWTSDAFRQRRHLVGRQIGGSGRHSQDLVFHSILGALGLESSIYRKELDIFQPSP